MPRKLWFRYSPIDDTVWIALPHDWICKHPDVLPRAIGDAIFEHLAGELAKAKRIDAQKAFEMAVAVRWFTRLKAWITEKD